MADVQGGFPSAAPRICATQPGGAILCLGTVRPQHSSAQQGAVIAAHCANGLAFG